ncbi:MarR family winged helix-turn-helix transcriptional regulator, partial [Chloroflexota bacterium]
MTIKNMAPNKVGKPIGLFDDRDYNLWVLLRTTEEAVVAVRKRELNEIGISDIESGVLVAVQAIKKAGGEPTPSEIARWLFRKRNSMSSLLTRMQIRGLVSFDGVPRRKNLIRINLTEKGLKIYKQSTNRVYVGKVFTSLSERQRSQFWSSLL